MLDALRKNKQSTWVKALLGGVVLVFMFWGVGTMRGGRLQVAAKVNGEIISTQEFETAFQNAQRTLSSRFQGTLPLPFLRQQTLDQLITARLLSQEAERLGLVVTDDEVRQAIAGQTYFQTDGKFNKDAYLNVLRGNGLTPGRFEASERERLLQQKVRDVVAAGVHVPETQARERFRYDNEQVQLRVVRVAAKDFLAKVTPSDQDRHAYYDAHRQDLREPERRKIRYALFTAERFGGEVNPTDAELRAYYDDHAAQFREVEEKGKERVIPFEEVREKLLTAVRKEKGHERARERVEDASERLYDGDPIEAVAKDFGVKLKTPKAFTRNGTIPGLPGSTALRKAAFKLKEGETGDVVTLDAGYVIFQLVKQEKSFIPDFKAVRDKVNEAVRQEQAAAQAHEKAEQFFEAVKADPPAFDRIAGEKGLAIKQVGSFRRQGGYISDLGNLPELKEAAFLLTEEKPIAPAVYDVSGDAVVAALGKRVPADEAQFEDQKEPLLAQERQKLEAAVVERFIRFLKGKAAIVIGEGARRAAG